MSMHADSVSEPLPPPPPPPRPRLKRLVPWLRGAALVIIGAAIGIGAFAASPWSRRAIYAPLTPAPIASVSHWSFGPVAVKGSVSELFGNKFILQDDSGRMLVDTGPSGDWWPFVAKDETITVQGRFEHGSIHAAFILHGNGKVDQVGPPPPPRRWPLSWLHAERGGQADGPSRPA